MPPTSNFGQDITNTSNNGGNEPNLAYIERMGGQLMLPRLAGKGVIRVVRRCEDAKENNKLGMVHYFFFLLYEIVSACFCVCSFLQFAVYPRMTVILIARGSSTRFGFIYFDFAVVARLDSCVYRLKHFP